MEFKNRSHSSLDSLNSCERNMTILALTTLTRNPSKVEYRGAILDLSPKDETRTSLASANPLDAAKAEGAISVRKKSLTRSILADIRGAISFG